MGITALVRWPNAPTNALDLVKQNIVLNHAGSDRGKWHVSIKSFRAVSDPDGLRLDRSMCCVTMGDRTFAVLDDQAAPQVADMAAFPSFSPSGPLSSPTTSGRTKSMTGGGIPLPPHYRTTLVTAEPVGALDSLLAQLGTRWASSRQQGTVSKNLSSSSGSQVMIEGSVFAIGSDWILRVGNVTLAGGAMKGMLLEAEYLPIPKLDSNPDEGTPELLSNMLIAMLPEVKNAAPVAVTVDDTQWAEVHWNCKDHEGRDAKSNTSHDVSEDDIFSYEEEEDPSQKQAGDWTDVERDRRSAFLIVGALRPEGMLST